ncbi:MAG: RDD family protein [Egibacteraceae bacterium]
MAGPTVGNKVCKIRLIHGTRGQSPYAGAFLRWLMSLVSAVPFGIGYLWMLRTRSARRGTTS